MYLYRRTLWLAVFSFHLPFQSEFDMCFSFSCGLMSFESMFGELVVIAFLEIKFKVKLLVLDLKLILGSEKIIIFSIDSPNRMTQIYNNKLKIFR